MGVAQSPGVVLLVTTNRLPNRFVSISWIRFTSFSSRRFGSGHVLRDKVPRSADSSATKEHRLVLGHLLKIEHVAYLSGGTINNKQHPPFLLMTWRSDHKNARALSLPVKPNTV